MKKRLVPNHYSKEVNQRLRRFTQETRSMENYYIEMEMLMIKAHTEETSEATMA